MYQTLTAALTPDVIKTSSGSTTPKCMEVALARLENTYGGLCQRENVHLNTTPAPQASFCRLASHKQPSAPSVSKIRSPITSACMGCNWTVGWSDGGSRS